MSAALRKIWNHKAVRNLVYLAIFLALWEFLVSLKVFSPLLFPSLGSIGASLIKELGNGSLFVKTGYSLYLIIQGIALSLVLAAVLTVLSNASRQIADLLNSIVALVDPLPGIALFPLAILWFGIGRSALLFIMVHSVLWPVLLNVTTGFRSVSNIYVDIGRNIGLTRFGLVKGVYLPASLPSILTGLRTGWARAWRALISAEMVFGSTGVSGGLGWDIFVKRSFLDVPGMYASLFVIMLIGLFMEEVVFKMVEKKTVKKWGMVR